LAFVATAAAIPVNDMLISMAETKQHRAKSSMTAWGLGPDAHHFENSVPGFSNVGNGLRTMDLNEEGALPVDLKACAGFENGLDIAAILPHSGHTIPVERPHELNQYLRDFLA